MRLARAILYVKDLRRMAEFYGGALGLQAVAETRSETWVEFETLGANLALHAMPAELAPYVEILAPPRVRDTNPVKLAFAVENVAAESARLEGLGVTMLRRPWGACDAVDPEGNIFQIYSAGEE